MGTGQSAVDTGQGSPEVEHSVSGTGGFLVSLTSRKKPRTLPKLMEGRGMPAIFIIALPPPNTVGGPALIIRCIQQLQRDSDQREGAMMMMLVLSKRKGGWGICREKKERSDCYCVYIEREDKRDSILKKTCTLNNCFAEMLLICSFAPATLPQPLRPNLELTKTCVV
ncbi:uncharacterized protein LOC117981308 isoform X1 [Pan paniscus]|uniref:uncharacterized protein LOC117981308 isoform X1 n=1 Tax=Pan paniscus TaxID=9597 RepID=UPI0030048901